MIRSAILRNEILIGGKSMDTLLEIQKKFNNFTEKEKKVARYILKNKSKIKNKSITNLATATDTSTATITRFSKKIGVNSFVELKMKLHTFNELENYNKIDDIFVNITNYYKKVLKNSQQLVDKSSINKLVEKIKNATKIYIYGIGSSGLTASEMMLRLLRMGFDVYSITDSHLMKINSAIISEKDLVISISISGKTKEIIKSLKVSKENGAEIVTITSFEDTPILQYSDMNFLIYNTAFVEQQRFINSQFSAMYLLDIICTILLQDKELNHKYQKTVSAILED